MSASVLMIPSATHRIQPRAPVDMSPTAPGAQPAILASGPRIAQPTNIPYVYLNNSLEVQGRRTYKVHTNSGGEAHDHPWRQSA